jgi:hypothetical protein
MAQMYLGSATRPTTARATDDVLLSRPEDIVADRGRKLLKNELPARKPVVQRTPWRPIGDPSPDVKELTRGLSVTVEN